MAAATAPTPTISSSGAAAMASSTATASSHTPPMSGKQKLPANGLPSRTKTSQNDVSKASTATMQDQSLASRHAHDRLLFLTANFVGHIAHVTVKSGERFSGVFSSASFDPSGYQILLKMSKRTSSPSASAQSQSNGSASPHDDYVGYGDDHLLTFDLKDVVHLHVANVITSSMQPRLANGSGIKTDADISGNLALRERELQRWEPAEDSALDLSMNGQSSGLWDQFEANERLYGVKTDYNEHFYTTTIDRSHPTYKQRAAAAERLAREIEGTATDNPHVAEERNLKSPPAHDVAADDVDYDDEETRFSGVKRELPHSTSSQASKYTPPALRAPTAHSTVLGAPVDPAIISSQLVRPDSTTKAPQQDSAPITATFLAPSETLVEDKDVLVTVDAMTPETTTESASLTQQTDLDTAKGDETDTNATSTESKETSSQATSGDANTNVEHRVADAFRNFAAIEKQNYREKQKAKARSEREFRLNDLKKFSMNFKLHTAVPEDILGILAREKPKQVQIIQKAQQEVEQHKAALADKAQNANIVESPEFARATAETQTDVSTSATAAAGSADRVGPKAPRGIQMQPPQGREPDRSMQHPGMNIPTAPRAPGHLGERLMQAQQQQQQQYQNRRDPRFQQLPSQPILPQDTRMQSAQHPQAPRPADINTNVPIPRQSAAATPTSAASRFNVQALEFKPNPTAMPFQASREESSTVASRSQDGSRPPKRPVNRMAFFGDRKPRASSEKKSVLENFNPIARMKREMIDANKSKDYALNGGIPQAYRTPPVWDTGKGNEEKSYVDMFEQGPSSAPSVSPGSYAMAHQHQLPPHLQSGSHASPPIHTPQQSYRMHPPNYPRDNYFEEHRMHHSPSQQSSVQPSPSMRQTILAYPQQMPGGHMQPQFIPTVGHPHMGINGNHVTPMRQFSSGPYVNAQGGHMATPMMPSHSSNGQYLTFPVQGQVPMFSPGGQQAFPVGMVAPHTPTPGGGFPSPRPGPQMMVPHGSQQGPGGSPYMMQGPAQGGRPGSYGKQYHPNQAQMHGGVPMMQQNSYGSHIPPQFQGQPRGNMPQMGGVGYAYQHMHPVQMMQMPPNQQHPHGPIRHPSDTSEAK